MYKIKYENDTTSGFIYEPGSETACVLSAVLTREMGMAGTLVMSLPVTNTARSAINCLTDEIVVYRDSARLWRGRIVTNEQDFRLTGTLTCEGTLSYLNDTIYPPFAFQQKSIRQFLVDVLTNHNANVEDRKKIYLGTISDSYENVNITRSSIDYDTSLNVLQTRLVEDTYGGYFRVVTDSSTGKKYLNYLDSYGTTATQAVELGVNILDVYQKIEYTDIATVLIPLGAKAEGTDERLTVASVNNGSIYVVNETAVAQYGRIERVVEWDDVTQASNLLTKATKKLRELVNPIKSVTVAAVDLGTDTAWNLGDSVHVVSAVHGVNTWMTLDKMKLDLVHGGRDTLTFGKSGTSMSKQSATVSSTLKKTAAAVTPTAQIVNAAKVQMQETITGAKGGHVKFVLDASGNPQELVILDTEDINTAVKVWRWNINGWAYSSSGYAGPYTVAANMLGQIIADNITAGTLQGIKIIGENGSVGGLEMTASTLKATKTMDFSTFTEDDITELREWLLGTTSLSTSKKEKLDVTNNFVLSGTDILSIRKIINGTDPNTSTCKITIDPSKSKGAITLEITYGQGKGKKTRIGFGSIVTATAVCDSIRAKAIRLESSLTGYRDTASGMTIDNKGIHFGEYGELSPFDHFNYAGYCAAEAGETAEFTGEKYHMYMVVTMNDYYFNGMGLFYVMTGNTSKIVPIVQPADTAVTLTATDGVFTVTAGASRTLYAKFYDMGVYPH